jgi:hypothetical protein
MRQAGLFGGLANDSLIRITTMPLVEGTILLNENGIPLPIDEAGLDPGRDVDKNATAIDRMIKELGFVLIAPARHALFIELCPFKARPLAALAAFYAIKDKRRAVDCVVLALSGDTWRRSQYEFFDCAEGAAEKMWALARAARRRTAGDVLSQYKIGTASTTDAVRLQPTAFRSPTDQLDDPAVMRNAHDCVQATMRSGTSSLPHVSGPSGVARIKLSAPNTVPIKDWCREPALASGS